MRFDTRLCTDLQLLQNSLETPRRARDQRIELLDRDVLQMHGRFECGHHIVRFETTHGLCERISDRHSQRFSAIAQGRIVKHSSRRWSRSIRWKPQMQPRVMTRPDSKTAQYADAVEPSSSIRGRLLGRRQMSAREKSAAHGANRRITREPRDCATRKSAVDEVAGPRKMSELAEVHLSSVEHQIRPRVGAGDVGGVLRSECSVEGKCCRTLPRRSGRMLGVSRPKRRRVNRTS
jgi:hypothetical protein